MNSVSMPGHDLINVAQVTDTALAAREREAAERVVRFPRLVGAGPAQFWPAEYDGRWRLRCSADFDPFGARVNLASILRGECEQVADPGVRAELMAFAARLDPEADEAEQDTGTEWTVAGRRFRVIRGHEFVRWGEDGPEPARATDIDPAGKYPERDFVLDPVAPTTPTDSALRLDLVNLVPDPQSVPGQVWTDARAALNLYPGVVLLPLSFRAMQRKEDGDWSPIGQGDGPAEARESLAWYFREFLPRFTPPDWSPKDIEKAAKAAERITPDAGEDFVVAARQFRIVRCIRMIRVGPDGPEPSRPSDEPPTSPQP